VERIGGAVIKDETDLELGACIDRISRMKTVCNKLTVIQNEKVRLIHNLHRQVRGSMTFFENMLTAQSLDTFATLNNIFVFHNSKQVVHRHETDQQLIDEVVNSEVLLRHLNARNVAMEADMEVRYLLFFVFIHC